jgi:hypothetical protein
MVYSNVKTFYISSKTDPRPIRYDVITIDKDTIQVKVIDDQQHGISHPSSLVQLDDFLITREQYNQKYPSGFQQTISANMAPGFENTISDTLQSHRNSIS